MIEMEKIQKDKHGIVMAALFFFVIVLAAVVGINVKNTMEQRAILEDSVKKQLISICVAAREILDVDAFDSYASPGDMKEDQARYDEQLAALRNLKTNVGADYIYALKIINGEAMFIFDTDTENDTRFEVYKLSPVHLSAFEGGSVADVMNVSDEFGSFNTGAVPIIKDGGVVGIISTDIRDSFIKRSTEESVRNIILLIAALIVVMAIVSGIMFRLFKRIAQMQRRLQMLAHYDAVTGLPNRQYLLDYLESITKAHPDHPFALLFIDLDNFKRVNDMAGHDAGDELLKRIAKYLEGTSANVKAFRPSAGILNIAARIGGDEFIQIVPGVKTEAEAGEIARDLLENFSGSVLSRYVTQYDVGLSIGVALYPYHSPNFHVLIKYADIAMYQAKNSGKNNYRVYEDGMMRQG